MVKEYPLAPMGVLAPGSAHARPSTQPPIDTSVNLLGINNFCGPIFWGQAHTTHL